RGRASGRSHPALREGGARSPGARPLGGALCDGSGDPRSGGRHRARPRARIRLLRAPLRDGRHARGSDGVLREAEARIHGRVATSRMAERVAVVASARTPIGKFLGSFADLTASDLGAVATRGVLERAAVDPSEVDELIYGCARQAGGGPNMARQVAMKSGIPKERPAFTVNQACGSGLQAILLGAERIVLGRARIVLAGGGESMTRVPYFLDRARLGYRLGNAKVVDGMYQDGFLDPICG